MLNKKGFQDRRSPFFCQNPHEINVFLICGFLFFMDKIMFKNAIKIGYTKKYQKNSKKVQNFHQKSIKKSLIFDA